MDLPTWMGFVVSSAVLLLVPGPTIALVMSVALREGTRAAAPLAAGVMLGHLTAMTLAVLGLAVVVSTSGTVFLGMKWVGAVYLLWLGVRLWFAEASAGGGRTGRGVLWGIVGHAWFVTALNPVSIMFFLAFLPQFLDPGRGFLRQAVVLEATFLSLAFLNALGYGLLAGRAGRVSRSPGMLRMMQVGAGTVMVIAGTWAIGQIA
jgi:threonine/homoserine/homoserine lactone efflux protein